MFVQIITPIIVFILGVCLASFGNVLICRYPDWKLFGKDKYSECPKCHHQLMWYDLFPILSYIFLKGKCRYCKEKISPRYLIVELFGGLLFLGTYLVYTYCYHQVSGPCMEVSLRLDYSGLSITNVICIAFALLILFLGSFIDQEHKEIPLTFSFFLFALAIINWAVDFALTKDYQLYSLIGLGVPLVLFGLIYLISTLCFKVEPIGLGDIIVYCALGLLMGIIQFVIILLISTVVCSIVESIKIKRTGKKEQIPFVPYIFIGFVVSTFLGELMSTGYLNLIGVR